MQALSEIADSVFNARFNGIRKNVRFILVGGANGGLLMMGCGSSKVIPVPAVRTLQGDYGELWSIRNVQVHLSSTQEHSMETASPPSYNHAAPPPPYTAHARLGEVSIHRSPLRDNDDSTLVGQPSVDWLTDSMQEHDINDDSSVAMENNEEVSFHDDAPGPLAADLLATSTPDPSSLNGHSPNSSLFVKSCTLPPVKPMPMLRPIRAENFSAPNLFTTYSQQAAGTHEIEGSPLNNTLPRVSRLPPLRRKSDMMNNSPRHTRSLSDGRLPLFCNNQRSLSLSISAGECGAISEVSHEPSSNETIDNS